MTSTAVMFKISFSFLLLFSFLVLCSGFAGQHLLSSDYSYVCSLERYQNGWRRTCSCVLLTSKTALTTASCVKHDSTKRLRVRCFKAGSRFTRDVLKVYTHEKYSTAPWPQNDLAVLYLQHPLPPLFPSSSPRHLSLGFGSAFTCMYDGCQCTVTTRHRSGTGWKPGSLQKTPVRSMYLSDCQNTWKQVACGNICFSAHAHSPDSGAKHKSMASSCFGQAGSPVVCGGVVTGLLSWGNAFHCYAHPLVFTHLPTFRGWIRKVLVD